MCDMPAGDKPGAASAAAGPGPWANQNKVPGIKRIVAVASGKGGVGKSTARSISPARLKHLGARVGLLDCDIYGPSIPLMMGIQPAAHDQRRTKRWFRPRITA